MMWYIILSIFLFKFNLQHNTELMRYLSRGFQLLIPSLFLFCTCFMTSSGKISGDVSERCTSNSDRGASKYVFSLCIFVFCVHVVFFFLCLFFIYNFSLYLLLSRGQNLKSRNLSRVKLLIKKCFRGLTLLLRF